MKLTDHNYCSVLSRLFRGKLCDQLTSQPGRRFAPGEFVYRMGDRASSVYFLRSGLVKSSVVSEGGKEFVLHLHKPGEIFGELCLCSGEQRQQTMAMEQSEVVQIRFEDLISHLQRNRQAMSDFLISVSQRLSDAYDQLQILAFDKTLERVARTLLKLADEFGKPTPEGVEIEHYVRQEELAQMIGASREVVSSSLNRLRAMGLISYPRKGRVTVNPQALQTYLSSANT